MAARRSAPGPAGLAAVAALLLLAAGSGQAQVQRTLINLGFEQPALGNGTCFRLISETVVPGWTTDHPVIATQTLDCDNANIPGAPATGAAMEFWANNFNATPARNGRQHVELNASAASRLSQSVCLVNGEQVNWVFSHRGRGSATIQDVMDYLVGATQIVRVGTTSNGSGGVVTTFLGTASSVAGPNGWRDYSGSFTYTGASGTSNLGFRAISTGSGSTTVGNFLDDIQISLRPFVEFVQSNYSKSEATAGSNVNIPRIRVSGTVPAGGMVVSVLVTGGTATLGSDYSTPGNSTTLSVAVPAGVYDGTTSASEFVLPVTVLADAVAEPDETVTFSLPAPSVSPPPYLLASTTTCGGATLSTSTLTITDASARVTLAKVVDSRPASGQSGFDIRIDQSGSTLASASTGLSNGAANSNASTGLQTVTPAVPVTLSESLSAGSAFLLNQFIATISCTNAVASATVLPSGESATGSWALTPAINDNITCTIRNQVRPPTFTVAKQVSSRADASDQFTVSLVQGGSTLASATTSGAGTSASTAATQVPSATAPVTVSEAMAAGSASILNQYTAGISCSNARPGGAASVTVSGSAPTWTVNYAPGDLITCTITNARIAPRLSLAKALGAARLSATDQFTMTVGGTGGGSATTTGAGSTVSGGTVTVASATIGANYTLSEAMAAGSSSTVASYSPAISCSNSRAGATTPLPSGSGSSFSVTPRAGDNISCVITNNPLPPNLGVTKSNATAVYRPGASASFTIVVSNAGPGPANGALVQDTLPAGMRLAAPWTCTGSGGATCPASGGTAGGSSVTLSANLPAGGSITIVVPVDYSANPADY